MKRGSLRKILIVVALAGLLPTVLPLGFLVYRAHEMATEEAIGDLRGVTYGLAAQLDMMFSGTERKLVELGGVDQIATGTSAQCQSWLNKNRAKADYVRDLFRLDMTGRVTCASTAQARDAKIDVDIALNSASYYNRTLVSPARVSASSGVPVVGVLRTFWNDGDTFQLMATLDVSWIENAIAELEDANGYRFFILDEMGQVIVSLPDVLAYSGKTVPVFKRVISPKQDPVIHTIEAGFEGQKRLASTVKLHEFIDGQGIYLSSSVLPITLFSNADEIILVGSLTLAFAVLGVVAAQYLVFTRYIEKPIAKITKYADQLAVGESPSTLPMPEDGPSELLDIAGGTKRIALENERRADALSEALQNLERAEEIAGLGHWRLDLQKNKLFWSEGVYRIHGLDPATFTPTLENAVEMYHPDDRESVAALVEDAAKSGESFDFVKRVLRSDDTVLFVRSRGFVMKDRDGAHRALFGIIMDVDAPKRSARELERAQKAAQHLADTRARILAMVSHEIKAPLHAIMEINQSVRQSLYDPELDNDLAMVDVTGQMLLTVIADLLDAAVQETGTLTLSETDVDIVALLHQCTSIFQAAYSKICIVDRVSHDLPETIGLDPQRMRQILFNLLSNACKQHLVTKVDIIAERVDDCLSICVQDDGPGISQDDQTQLFEPFNRVGEDHPDNRGTGLGLSIVKTLIAQMGGEVSVSSELGSGATFTVTLPLKIPMLQTALSVDQSAAASNTNPILVVEDNPVNQRLLTSFLAKNGFSFVVHNDGQAAMEWLLSLSPNEKERLPCLALIDINMPRLDGVGLAEFIRTQWQGPSNLPIYFVTADYISDHSIAMQNLSIDGFIMKPFNFDELHAIARQFHASQGQRPAA
ncbi:MAG: ATP-binding protein [Pseudomonadota bacterium]